MKKQAEEIICNYQLVKEAGIKEWALAAGLLGGGPIAGTHVGMVGGSLASIPDFDKAIANYQSENLVSRQSIQEFINKNTNKPSAIKLINHPKEAVPYLTGKYKFIANTPILNTQFDPNVINAFVMPHHGNYILGTPSKGVHPQVLGHELGHVSDIKRRGVPSEWTRGVFGALSGEELAQETRAWNRSPIYSKGHPLRDAALKTYRYGQTGARSGAGLGLLGSLLGLAGMRRGRRKP